MTKLIFIVFFQIFQNFSIYKFKKILWHNFGAPLRAAPGGRCPPCPPSLRHCVYLIQCGVFLLLFCFQVMLKLYGMGFEFFKSRMEVFDAVIIISSFVLDLVFMEGVGVDRGEEAAALLIMFLLWRILRVINGNNWCAY